MRLQRTLLISCSLTVSHLLGLWYMVGLLRVLTYAHCAQRTPQGKNPAKFACMHYAAAQRCVESSCAGAAVYSDRIIPRKAIYTAHLAKSKEFVGDVTIHNYSCPNVAMAATAVHFPSSPAALHHKHAITDNDLVEPAYFPIDEAF